MTQMQMKGRYLGYGNLGMYHKFVKHLTFYLFCDIICEENKDTTFMKHTVGHMGIYAWGNRVRRQFLGGGAVVVEPRIPCL